MRISDWSSDVCSSDLAETAVVDAEVGEQDLKQRDAPAVGRIAVTDAHALGRSDSPGFGRIALHCPRRCARRVIFRRVGEHGQLFENRFGGHSRSEEHTSELQSLMRISYAVFCLKKKNK